MMKSNWPTNAIVQFIEMQTSSVLNHFDNSSHSLTFVVMHIVPQVSWWLLLGSVFHWRLLFIRVIWRGGAGHPIEGATSIGDGDPILYQWEEGKETLGQWQDFFPSASPGQHTCRTGKGERGINWPCILNDPQRIWVRRETHTTRENQTSAQEDHTQHPGGLGQTQHPQIPSSCCQYSSQHTQISSLYPWIQQRTSYTSYSPQHSSWTPQLQKYHNS